MVDKAEHDYNDELWYEIPKWPETPLFFYVLSVENIFESNIEHLKLFTSGLLKSLVLTAFGCKYW